MSFLQSDAWRDFQEALGRQTYTDSGSGWHYLAILETGRGNRRLYCPYGPEFDNTEALDQAVQSLVKLAKKLKIDFVRVEPTDRTAIDYLKANHWQKVNYQSLNPELTHLVSLTDDEPTIISRMSQVNRNLYRNYSKKGLSITESTNPDDIEIFLEMIKQVARRTGITPHSDDYFRLQARCLFPTGQARLFTVQLDGQPIAASIAFDDLTTRYYGHAAADETYRKLGAGNILVAHMIIDAKQRGLQQFDLFGVAPADSPASHPWYGFSKFKRSFGGTDTAHAGSWDLAINPLVYRFYRLSQQVLRRLR